MGIFDNMNSLVAILVDENGYEKARYDNGEDDGRIVITNDEDIYIDIVLDDMGGLF